MSKRTKQGIVAKMSGGRQPGQASRQVEQNRANANKLDKNERKGLFEKACCTLCERLFWAVFEHDLHCCNVYRILSFIILPSTNVGP